MFKIVFFLLLVFGLGSGCDAVEPVDFDTLSQEPAALVGTWTLERHWSYWSGRRDVTIPEQGYVETWTFTSDGVAIHEFASGDAEPTVRTTTYAVTTTPQRRSLVVDGLSYSFGIDRDRLILLAQQIGDAPEEVYRRER